MIFPTNFTEKPTRMDILFIRGKEKPDFIVHEPGNMDNNLVVMEVKSIVGAKNENSLNADLGKTQIIFG